jgi:hypothetical protein
MNVMNQVAVTARQPRAVLLLALAALPVAAFAQVQSSDAPLDRGYVPLSAEERMEFYVREKLLDPGIVFASAGQAVGAHASDEPPELGQGGDAYARRFASQLGFNLLRVSAESAGAAALGQDPRYVRCRCSGFFRRAGHAAVSGFATYSRNGDRVFAPARVGSYYVASMTQSAWMPSRLGWKDGLRVGTQSFAFGSGTNLIREFAPELKRLFGFSGNGRK